MQWRNTQNQQFTLLQTGKYSYKCLYFIWTCMHDYVIELYNLLHYMLVYICHMQCFRNSYTNWTVEMIQDLTISWDGFGVYYADIM